MRRIFIFTFILLFIVIVNFCHAQQGTYGLKFQGNSNYVNCGANASLNITGTQLTLEAWVFPTSFSANYWENVIVNKLASNTTHGYNLRCGGNGIVEFYVSETYANTGFATSDQNAIELNKWSHLAGTYDGSNVKLYINGKLVKSTSWSFSIGSTDRPLFIGNHGDESFLDRPFIGSIDEVRVWDIARTEAEIKANMYKEIGTHANLKAYYKMSNGSGTTLTDNSGNGNNGTLINGPLWKFSGCLGGSKQALDFDGSNDNVSFGYNAPFVLTTSVSIEAWVNITTTAQQCFVAGKIIHGGSNYGYGMYINNGNLGGDPGQITFIAGRSWSDWPSVRSISKLETNKWYHIAATFDGRYLKISSIKCSSNMIPLVCLQFGN